MATATIAAFDRVHANWQALIDEAIQRFRHFPSVPHLAPITDGRSVVVWNNLHRSTGTDNKAASYLVAALIAQANRYQREGLGISADEARWVALQLSNNDMTVIDACHL
jgi:hypothetical protein